MLKLHMASIIFVTLNHILLKALLQTRFVFIFFSQNLNPLYLSLLKLIWQRLLLQIIYSGFGCTQGWFCTPCVSDPGLRFAISASD